MGMEYPIYNLRTKKYLLGTKGYGAVVPDDLIGTVAEIAARLKEKVRDSRPEYFVWAAEKIAEHLAGCSVEEIEIEPDYAFYTGYKSSGDLYAHDQDLKPDQT